MIRSEKHACEYPATLGPAGPVPPRVLEKPQLENAGYRATVDLTGVVPGAYGVYIGQTTQAGTRYCLIDRREIVVQ